MSTLRYVVKISRPMQCTLGGLTAWLVALLSNGPSYVTLPKVMAGVVIFLSILASSVWHYGARADVYARKHWDPVFVKNPRLLMFFGAILFIASMILAGIFLPVQCMIIAMLNAIIIMLYAKKIDRYWPWKNLAIAGVCVTPLVLGWFSGHRMNSVLPSLILATFCVYLAREIFKDIVDIQANRGKRFTMVMEIGLIASLRIGGIALSFAILLILYSLQYISNSSICACIFSFACVTWLSWFAIRSLAGKNIASSFAWMDVGAMLMLMSLFAIRLNMY